MYISHVTSSRLYRLCVTFDLIFVTKFMYKITAVTKFAKMYL